MKKEIIGPEITEEDLQRMSKLDEKRRHTYEVKIPERHRGPCESERAEICPDQDHCPLAGRCCDCIKIRGGKMPGCLLQDIPEIIAKAPAAENWEPDLDVHRACSSCRFQDCPCPKTSCKFHGRCCLCLSHHAGVGGKNPPKRPYCLRTEEEKKLG